MYYMTIYYVCLQYIHWYSRYLFSSHTDKPLIVDKHIFEQNIFNLSADKNGEAFIILEALENA